MKGERYLKGRIRKMEKSNARTLSGIIMRVALVTILLISGYLFCDQGLKFVNNHPELDCTHTDK